jgi:hypothetical protein
MSKQQLVKPPKNKSVGQSLIELSLILLVLLILLTGMIEFGNLLNQYINIIDGAREGARFGSNDDPFESHLDVDGVTVIANYEYFFSKVYLVVEGQFKIVGGVEVQQTKGAIDPLVLRKANHDDIVVSFFSLYCHRDASGALETDGSGNYVKDVKRFMSNLNPPHHTRYNEQDSRFSDSQIAAMMDCNAPNSGTLLVEVFYHYFQILKMYGFFGFPDPMLLHAYSIMPLSSAEPTPTNLPSP